MASTDGKPATSTKALNSASDAATDNLKFSLGMRLCLVIYEIAWLPLLPFAFLMLWRRGKREPVYRQFWSERLGRTVNSLNLNAGRPIWVHSASLGEMRGAAPLFQALLDQQYSLLITTLTPAGRNSAQSQFSEAIKQGKAQVCFVPIEQSWAINRLIARFNPRCALMTEIDTWPLLVSTIRKAGVKLAIANAQYPKQSLARDLRWGGFRAKLFRCYQLVLCKSETHAERFKQVGCAHVEVAGETRFDLPIPQAQLNAASTLVKTWGLRDYPTAPNTSPAAKNERTVICIASSVAGEEQLFLELYRLIQAALKERNQPKPLFIHVPRSPQCFDQVYEAMTAKGLTVARRSQCLSAQLALPKQNAVNIADVDVLLGDSLREMYFYLALAMVVVVGASFVPLGSHNVIEPLGLKKPVMVGPSIWGIEYPGVEALAAGVLQQHQTIESLAQAIINLITLPAAYAQATENADGFYATHAGATQRHMAILNTWIPE